MMRQRSLLLGWLSAIPIFLVALLATPAFAENELPEGAGKQIIQQRCAGCHPGAALASYQKTRQDWDAVVARMGQRTDATKDELDTLTDYLATNFPKVEDPNKVNVNKAPAKEISERLGLTMKEAEAIVDYRDHHGMYHTWGDLLVIYGVDGSKIEAVQDKISF
jgi:competence ComEA-like helix-hairpin-helix protein